MQIICKVAGCPFRSTNNFCRNKLVSITNQGFCGHVYFPNGQVRNDWQEQVEEKYMEGFLNDSDESSIGK